MESGFALSKLYWVFRLNNFLSSMNLDRVQFMCKPFLIIIYYSRVSDSNKNKIMEQFMLAL